MVPVPAGHDAAEQVVLAEYSWHATVPSQRPLVPQLVAPWSAQTPRGSIAPAGTIAQIPRLPGTPHDWHEPQVTEPQHTPSTQAPERQSLAAAQD